MPVPPAVELIGVRKDYRGLRPLRILDLGLAPGEIVAVSGFDAITAEVMTNLITGATLPDEGEVRVSGASTEAVDEAGAWLAFTDRFGIVSERVVLLDPFSVAQNIALPITLELDPLGEDTLRTVARLASEVGLSGDDLFRTLASAPSAVRLRIRLARAIALSPQVLLLEHPTAGLPRGEVARAARDTRRVARERGATVLAMTEDPAFARGVADRMLRHEPMTGALGRQRTWNRIFG